MCRVTVQCWYSWRTREKERRLVGVTYKNIDRYTQDNIMFDDQWGYLNFLYFIKRHDCENTNIADLKEAHQGVGSTQCHWSQLLCKLYSPALQACFPGSNKFSLLPRYHLFKYEGYEWMSNSARRVPCHRCIFTPVDIWHNNNVIITLKRRHDVIWRNNDGIIASCSCRDTEISKSAVEVRIWATIWLLRFIVWLLSARKATLTNMDES